MTIQEMHYDFKQKLNKIDSQQYRNLRIPEIDWKINEAYEVFVKTIAQPRYNNPFGFEINQRTIEDIRTIVVNDLEITTTAIVLSPNTYLAAIPVDYMFYISAEVLIDKVGCEPRVARAIVVQHDDRFEISPFDTSSFEWKEVNVRFFEDGLKIFTDGTFTVSKVKLNYIKKHPYIHFASGFTGGTYTLPSGVILTGTQNCLLPEQTHREIIDLAVLITSGDLSMQDYQMKQTKTKLT